jgi:hypothetical protein
MDQIHRQSTMGREVFHGMCRSAKGKMRAGLLRLGKPHSQLVSDEVAMMAT